MARTLGRSSCPLALFLAMLWLAASPMTADLADAPAPPPDPTVGTPIRSVYLRPPQRPTRPGAPVQVLVALHGMGGNGPDFSSQLVDQADRYGWLIVAPTIAYGDWTNPGVVAGEDPVLIQALSDYLDTLPSIVGAPVRHLVLVLGHSRGAQLAHRLAEFRPDHVLAVAAMSAGTYTMPESSGPGDTALNFPFGLGDMDRYTGHAFDADRFDTVAVLVGVGGQDTTPGDVPRQWDGVEGANRLQRAQAFQAAAHDLGANTQLRVFAEAHHELNAEMRSAACEFLQAAAVAQSARVDVNAVDAAPI